MAELKAASNSLRITLLLLAYLFHPQKRYCLDSETEVYPPKRKLTEVKPEDKSCKRPRLVFTDIQRRTLHAIFKETKRPSKEMQATIAQQLDLEVSTVANFFMNARRRSLDKWQEDNEHQLNESSSPTHSLDPASPAPSSQQPLGVQPPSSAASDSLLPPTQAPLHDSLLPTTSSSGGGVDFSDSPEPTTHTPDLPTQVPISAGGGVLVTAALGGATAAGSHMLTQSVQLLPRGPNAILLNNADERGVAGNNGSNGTTCLISSATGLPVPLTSLSLPPPPPLYPAPSVNVENFQGGASPSPSGGLVLPSAATLIGGHDRGGPDDNAAPNLQQHVKQEGGPISSGHVAVSINPKK